MRLPDTPSSPATREELAAELAQTRAALAEIEARFEQTFGLGLIGMALTSPETGWIRVNDRLCEILGYPRDELVQKTWTELTHPDDLEVDVGHFEQVLAGEIDGYSLEKRFIRSDGAVIEAEISANCLRRPDGSVDHFVAFVQDISHRKRAERQLRESELRFRTFFELGGSGYAITTPETGWIHFNDRLCEILGYTRAELSDLTWVDVTHPDDLAKDLDRYGKLLSGELERYEMRKRFLRKDGAVIRGLIHVGCMRTETGAVEFVISSLLDETEREALEDQLRQSQKLEAVGQLAGGVAHDFNNLLTAIHGSADLLTLQPNRADRPRLLEQITTAAERAADLTRQLLAFSRKGGLQTIRVDVHDIVERVRGLLARSIDRRITVELRLEAEGAVVEGDPTQLESALLNLGLNARDAMPEGGVLTFATRWVAEDADLPETLRSGRAVEVSVSDTGQGMTAEVRERIFEPFFTTKPMGVGTGLGLAAVYGCVQSHGGLVRVSSEPGQGSQFRILLPASGAPASAARAVESQRPRRGEGVVLVIEDEALIRGMLSQMLAQLGYTAEVVDGGAAGIASFEARHDEIDLVLLDLIMPKPAGEETHRRLREIDPTVPVVIMSGYSDRGVADRVLESGAVGFLDKPFSVLEISRELSRHLSGQAS